VDASREWEQKASADKELKDGVEALNRPPDATEFLEAGISQARKWAIDYFCIYLIKRVIKLAE
jgi:hypothetical protein